MSRVLYAPTPGELIALRPFPHNSQSVLSTSKAVLRAHAGPVTHIFVSGLRLYRCSEHIALPQLPDSEKSQEPGGELVTTLMDTLRRVGCT